MRSLTTLLFTLIACTTTPLLAQGPWEPAPVPQGKYVPNQLILRFTGGYPGTDLKTDFEQAHGVSVSVRQINAAATDFLITVYEGIDQENCKRNSRAEAPLRCSMCDILGNPGGGGPMGQADGVWPNYIGSAGLTNDTNTSWQEISSTVMENGYAPFYKCPSTSPLPSHNDASGGLTTIAILDSGIHADTPGADFDDFFTYGQNRSIVEWVQIWDPMLPGDLPYDRIDPNGHGTAVGFLAAHEFINNQRQEDIKLLSFRVLGDDGTGNLADALRALDQAVINGADIINMSFGFQGLTCDGKEDPIFDPYLANALAQKVLVFCSAGNSGNDIGIHQQWPAAEAGHPGFYTIGATDCITGSIWDYSNYNNLRVDLLAPGTNIVVPYVNTNTPGDYIAADGTSFASPLAAAVAASYLHFTSFEGMLCLLESPGLLSESSHVRVGDLFDIVPSSCPITFPTPGPNDDPAPNPGNDVNGLLATNPGQTLINPFPNPFSSTLTITTSSADQQPAEIQLLSAGGGLISVTLTTAETLTLDVRELKAGVYYVRVLDAKGARLSKVVKQ